MVYSLRGTLAAKKDGFVVVDVAGVGFRVFLSEENRKILPQPGEQVNLFCATHVKQDGIELYGFFQERELSLFELLNSVSGIGPKSALNILNVAPVEQIVAAVADGKADLLTRSPGIGAKTAGRIVLELREKLSHLASDDLVREMKSQSDVEQALVGLGYGRREVREALQKIGPDVTAIEEKIRQSLRYLKSS